MSEFTMELESKVISVGKKRVKLTVCIGYCGYRFFSMENLSPEKINLLRKNIGSNVKAIIEYDPWHGASVRTYLKLKDVKSLT